MDQFDERILSALRKAGLVVLTSFWLRQASPITPSGCIFIDS